MEPVSCCSVCVEPYSAKASKYVCDECGYEACRTCVLRYVEGSDHEPKCMGCGHMWSRKFLFDTMSHAVYKRMVNKSVIVEVQRQKAMLASTVPYVEMERERDAADKEAVLLERQIVEMAARARNWRSIATNIQGNMNNFARGELTIASSRPTRVFLGRCTRDECRGFVDSETHLCAVCYTKHCKRCLEEVAEGHECDENVVENVVALRATCKACPKCCAPIQKIHGCNDMFCVACATAFCWRTMKIHENGNSNPHYYEWLRDGRDHVANDRPTMMSAGAFLDRDFMRNENFKSLKYKHRNVLTNILQVISHQRQAVHGLTIKHTAQTRQMKATLERAAYLKKSIDDAEFKKRIKRIQTDAEHAEMIGNTHALLQRARSRIIEMEAGSSVQSVIDDVVGTLGEYNEGHAEIAKIFSRKPFNAVVQFD